MAFEKCNHADSCHHIQLSPLRYYYDDDWGVRGNKVWYSENGKEHAAQLCVCLDCGTVLVVEEGENDIK